MARLLFWFTVFGILSSFPILVESETEEITELQKPDDDNVATYSPNNKIRLIMSPMNRHVPCDSVLRVCGIDMCVGEIKGITEAIDIGSQSSILDDGKMQVSHVVKWCFCNNIEAVLVITQQIIEATDKYFLDYRVQEVAETGCKAIACDWRLTVVTRIPNENGGNPDVIGCISSNTCMVACEVRHYKLIQDTFNFVFLAIMVLPCVISVILCITFKRWRRIARASPKIQGGDMGTNSPQQAEYLPPLSAGHNDNSETVL